MNEFHSVGTHDITSPSNDKFHEEWMWVCLKNVDETHEPPP